METHWGEFAYNYWWGLSIAQIELGLSDQPFVDFDSNSKDKNSHTREEMNDLAAQWEEKRKKNGGSMLNGWETKSVDDILNGTNKVK